jgi:hypothetical protein
VDNIDAENVAENAEHIENAEHTQSAVEMEDPGTDEELGALRGGRRRLKALLISLLS